VRRLAFVIGGLSTAVTSLLGACSSASTATREAPEPNAAAAAVPSILPLKYTGPATRPAIVAADMMTRLYIIADDSMMGRAADTPYNAKGALYIERELKRMGLQPAGENGTYFQFPLEQREIDPSATITVGGRALKLWTEFAPRDQGAGCSPRSAGRASAATC